MRKAPALVLHRPCCFMAQGLRAEHVQNMSTLQSTSGPSYRIKTQVALVQDAGLSRSMPHICWASQIARSPPGWAPVNLEKGPCTMSACMQEAERKY